MQLDPDRRTDPGHSFPWDDFFALLRPAPAIEEDDMLSLIRCVEHNHVWAIAPDGSLATTVKGVRPGHVENAGIHADLVRSKVARGDAVHVGHQAVLALGAPCKTDIRP